MKDKRTGRQALRNIVMSAMVILFFVSIIILYYIRLHSETSENIIKSGELNAVSCADTINKYLSTGIESITIAGYSLDNMITEGRTTDEMLDYLTNQSIAISYILSDSTTGLYAYINGTYLDGAGWVPDGDYEPTERPWYIVGSASRGRVVVVDPYLDAQTGSMMITLAKTLCDEKSVVALDLSLEELQRITEQLAANGASDIEIIMDRDLNVIAHSDKNQVGQNYKLAENGFGRDLAAALGSSSEQFFSFTSGETEYMVYSKSLENSWICLSITDTTGIYRQLRGPLILTITATVLVITVLLAIMINSNRKTLLAEKLSLETEKALAASEAKSSFLSNMSHEIRTPINAVLGMNEMILRECSDPAILDYSRSIKVSGNVLLGLVNNILDFSKIEAGKIDIIPVDYDLPSVINDLVNMLHTRADEKGLQLELDFDPALPRVLNGDEIRVKQVITNILTNAVKYTEKGSITFSIGFEKCERDDCIMLQVSVKDTGIGIREEDLQKLFLKFERVDEKRNRHIEGTGLGLSITRNLLEMMGSELNVSSVYGLGSRFSFSLMQRVVNAAPMGDYKTAYSDLTGEEKKPVKRYIMPKAAVLAVDDNPMNLMVIRGLLKQTLVQVDRAGSGDDALKMTEIKKYDLIFLDHMMPGKDGIETLHELKARKENPNLDTPVVSLTANAISGAREYYLAEGFTDYLSKPIEYEKLEKMLLTYIPDRLIEVTEEGAENTETVFHPEELLPLEDNPFIDLDKGIKNSGGADGYLPLLEMFYRSIDSSYKELDKLYNGRRTKDYVIRVHGLKSSARTIGAMKLGDAAQKLEDAGKNGDWDYIRTNHDAFLKDFLALREPLSKVFSDPTGDSDKPLADETLLSEAFSDLRTAAKDMDCDRLAEIFSTMDCYRIPAASRRLWDKLRAASDEYDYEEIIKLLG